MTSRQTSSARDYIERRLDPRHSANVEAIVDDPQRGPLKFTARGFSRTGAFLQRQESSTPLPAVGETIRLIFKWPLETQIPPVQVEARVVRQTDDGVGVQFDITA